MSDSVWNDPRITAYVLGELPADQRQAFEAELAGSPELAAAVAQARGVTGQLEAYYAAEPAPSLEAGRRQSILTPPPERSWRIPVLALATAAALLLVVGGPLVIKQNGEIAIGKLAQKPARNDSGIAADESELRINTKEELAQDGQAAASGTLLDESRTQSLDVVSEREDAFAAGLANEAILGNNPSVVAGRSAQQTATPESATPPGVAQRVRAEPPSELGAIVLGAEVKSDMRTQPQSVPVPGIASELARKRTRLSASVPNQANRRYERLLELSELESESLYDDFDDLGRGAGIAGDKFDPITDNPFRRVAEHPLSTFSVDVDTASYSKTRDFLTRANSLPRPDAVRIEELINYFDYDYDPPAADSAHPFTAHTVVTSCPWNKQHRLARIALQGKVLDDGERPRCNLVFLLDTSGSMNAPNKLPLVVEGMRMLLKQLDEEDRVAITVYAGSAGLVLDSTPAKKRKKIRNALTQLNAGGSTNGGAGIALAYQTARDHFITGGVNRVILCTDGDFNVGTTGTDSLVRMLESEAKGGIFLTVLGFGMGNHNDAMLEQISGRGNGNYAFIDTKNEAHKVLVQQTNSTLVTIAKDVKLQIEFNPRKVSSYRLIGYENRVLAKEDFNDDKKDAGEIGAGHAVTALYEVVPAGVDADESRPEVDDLKYQSQPRPTDAAESDELMTLKVRYKQPDGDTTALVEFPVIDDGGEFENAEIDVRFAAAVAGFGMQLRRSDYKGSWTLSDVAQVAEAAKGEDQHGLRSEFVELVRKASELMGQQ